MLTFKIIKMEKNQPPQKNPNQKKKQCNYKVKQAVIEHWKNDNINTPNLTYWHMYRAVTQT